MNILMIEQPLNNRGDESAHRGIVARWLSEYPQDKITVLFYGRAPHEIEAFRVESPNVEYVNLVSKYASMTNCHRMLKLVMMLNMPAMLSFVPGVSRILAYIRKADYILCAPGGINLGGFQDWVHVARLTMVQKTGKPLYYFARSIGPFSEANFWSKRFKKKSLELLHYFSFLSLRDRKSQLFAEELGLSYVPTIDSAFLREVKYHVPEDVQGQLADSKYIAFIPNSLAWHKNFNTYTFAQIRTFWVKLLDALLLEYPDKKIVMLPQTMGYSANLPDGYRFFNEIKTQCCAKDRVVVLAEEHGSDIQQSIIKNAQFLIGARYHSVVFALNQAIPFISLSYEHKMNGLLESLGKIDCQMDLTQILDGSPIEDVISRGCINNIVRMSHFLKPDINVQIRARTIAENGFEKLISMRNEMP